MLDMIRLALARLLETVADRLDPDADARPRDIDHAHDLAELLIAAADPAPAVTLARIGGQVRAVWLDEDEDEKAAPGRPAVHTVRMESRVIPLGDDAERAHLIRAVAAMEG